MSLVQAQDFNTHLYHSIINCIDRDNENLLDKAIEVAEYVVKNHIGRYNITDLFGKTGADRNFYLMQLIKNLAVWEFIKLANPNLDYEYWRIIYEDTMRELEKIAKGSIIPFGWVLADEPSNISNEVIITSQRQRQTRY